MNERSRRNPPRFLSHQKGWGLWKKREASSLLICVRFEPYYTRYSNKILNNVQVRKGVLSWERVVLSSSQDPRVVDNLSVE